MLKHHPALRRIAAAAGFVLLLAALMGGADAVLSPKSDTMAAFYAEPEDTVDVMFIGGSHGAAAFDPIQLWEERGFTAYNLFSWGQPPWTTYHYVVEALKTQRPKVVVVEGFAFMYQNSYLSDENFNETSDDFSLLMRPSANRAQLAAAMSRCQTNHLPIWRYASLPRYHNRWQVFDPSFLTFFTEDHYGTSKGFGPNYTTEAFPAQTPPVTLPQARLYPYCEEYLQKLIALSRSEGFELVVATAPWVIERDTEWTVLAELSALCQAEGVPVVDYNLAAGDEAGIDFATDLAEHAHVNLTGAEKITTHMGAFLDETYDLPDRRGGDAYAYWNDAATAEDLEQDKMRLMLSPDAEEYLTRLNDERLVAFIATRGDVTRDNEKLRAGFAALGLPADVLDGTQPGMVAVVDGGQVAVYEAGSDVAATYEANGIAFQLAASPGVASLLADGRECAMDYDGLVVLVLDKVNGTFVQDAAFLPGEGWATRTD